MDKAALTPQQQTFAADNHSLIYSFLKIQSLNADDYYDIVVFGFLDAVKEYLNKPDLALKYKFSTIAYQSMNDALCEHFKKQSRLKRKAVVLSLDSSANDEDEPFLLHETVSAPNPLMMALEAEFILFALAQELPSRQMGVIRMKAEGCGVKEIAKSQQMTIKNVQHMLASAKDAVLAICS